MTFDERIEAAIDSLNDRHAFFLTYVLNCGNIRPSMDVGTVDVISDEGHVAFRVNPEWAETQSPESVAHALSHVVMHLLLGHRALVEQFPDVEAFDQAIDASINDMLIANGMQSDEELLRGEALVEKDCRHLSVGDVYTLLTTRDEATSDGDDDGDPSDDAGDDAPGDADGDNSDTDTDEESADITDSGDEDSDEDTDAENGDKDSGDADADTGKDDTDKDGDSSNEDADGSDDAGDDSTDEDSDDAGEDESTEDGVGEDEDGSDQSAGDGDSSDEDSDEDGDGTGESTEPNDTQGGSSPEMGEGTSGGIGIAEEPSEIPGGGQHNSGQLPPTLDDHEWIRAEDPELDALVEEILENIEDDVQLPDEVREAREGFGGSVSDEPDGAWQDAQQMHVSLQWAEIVRYALPNLETPGSHIGPPKVPTYVRRPRRFTAFSETYIPERVLARRGAPKRTTRPNVVFALDTSGSIDRRQVSEFIALAQSIPSRGATVFPCTFTTSWHPVNLFRPEFPIGYTNFSAIEQFIREYVIRQTRQYPQAVFVLTDGKSGFGTDAPEEEVESRWHWLLPKKDMWRSERLIGQSHVLDDLIG